MQRAGEVATPKSGFANPLVVKNAAIDLDRLTGPPIRPPLAELGQNPDRIEREAVVGRFAHAEETLRTVSHFLPPRAQRDRVLRIPRQRGVEESLMQIKVVAIRRARTAAAKFFEGTLQLAEHSEVRGGVEVGVQQITLEQETILIGRLLVEYGLVVTLVFHPRFTPEGKIPSAVCPERDVFRAVEKFGALRGVAEKRPIFVVAQRPIAGTLCRKKRWIEDDNQRRERNPHAPERDHRSVACRRIGQAQAGNTQAHSSPS